MSFSVLECTQNRVIWDIDAQDLGKAKKFSRIGMNSYFDNIDLLRRHHSEEILNSYPELKKLEEAFNAFLVELEDARSQTPCLVGRFKEDSNIAPLMSITSNNIQETLLAFQTEDKSNIIFRQDYVCNEFDKTSKDTHVALLGYLTAFQSEKRENKTDFYEFCKRKLHSRIHIYTKLLLEFGTQPHDVQSLLEMDSGDAQVLTAHQIAMGIISFRFSFGSSSWEPQKPFEFFAGELCQKGPHILYGIFPPLCYKEQPKKYFQIKGKSIVGWPEGAEKINRAFKSSIIVIGYQKGEKKNLLFYISPSTYYESSQIYVSSYETIKELAEFCFHEIHAIYLKSA